MPIASEGKGRGKRHAIDAAPLVNETHCRSVRVVKRFHSFTGTPTRLFTHEVNHTRLCLPSGSWFSFTNRKNSSRGQESKSNVSNSKTLLAFRVVHIPAKSQQSLICSFRDFVRTHRQTSPKTGTCSQHSWRTGRGGDYRGDGGLRPPNIAPVTLSHADSPVVRLEISMSGVILNINWLNFLVIRHFSGSLQNA